ncbi:MAG: nucleotide exchange factor GrpE [Oligoflexia bacterium]|nr:nucleotide exchange factor GrpE [Oligoflexia bacterium]
MSDPKDDANDNVTALPVKDIPTESDPAKNELEELKKQNLYLRADFDNYRKQMIKERSDLIKFGSEPVIREFLNVLDNLELAANTELTTESLEKYKSGIQMIIAQFSKSLERFGVEAVDAKGQIFDPTMHEALTSSNNPDLPPNVVTQVFKKAYKLNGKIIRPAQVVVNTPQKEG